MKSLDYKFPLSRATGKIRIKERLAFSDYGQPIAPTQTLITPKHYIEWQIGYDRIIESNEATHFVGANGKNKQIYELSEFLAFGLDSNLISRAQLENLREQIAANTDFIDEKEKITREHFINEKIGGMEFLKSRVNYPLLVHRFGGEDALCEIIVREKQRAVGVMPMLYFCVPMSAVLDEHGECSFVGRQIAPKENGYLRVDGSNLKLFMEMFRIFGLLSRAHNHDCIEILNYILSERR